MRTKISRCGTKWTSKECTKIYLTRIACRQEMKIGDSSVEFNLEFIHWMSDSGWMWDDSFDSTNISKLLLQLSSAEASPTHSASNRAVPNAREFEKNWDRRCASKGVVVPGQAEWVEKIKFASKNDGSLRFCVDPRKLNAVTKQDIYAAPPLNECTDTTSNAALFLRLNSKCGCLQV